MKKLPAILASLAITAVIAIAMLAIGTNALLNPNSVPVVNAASDATATSAVQSTTSLQADQLQSLISQYQDREKQYQAQVQELSQRVQDANQQLQQANQTIQQDGAAVQSLQQVLVELQRRGLIQITNDGRIYINGHSDDD